MLVEESNPYRNKNSLGAAEGGKETEPTSQVMVQFVFLPHTHEPQYAIGLEQAATQYFVPDASVRNTVVLQTSLNYGGIDVGHFREWTEKTGNYFDGYLQHGATSTGAPLPPSEIAKQRELFEELYQNGFGIDWSAMHFDNEIDEIRLREETFILSCLFALEKMPEGYNVGLEVQPFSGQQLLRLLVRNKSFLFDKETKEQKQYADRGSLLIDARNAIHSEMQGMGNIYRDRINTFEQYLQKVIDEAQAFGGKTRLLVPMDHIGLYTTYPNMQEGLGGNTGLELSAPQFIGSGNYYPDPELSVMAKYVRDPSHEMTEEDLVKIVASRIFAASLEEMPGNWLPLRGRMMPTVIGRSTIAELEGIIDKVINDQEEPPELTEAELEAPEFMQKLMVRSRRKPVHEDIVDFYTHKTGSFFTYDPWKP